MKKYYYKARDKAGNLVTGEVEASNQANAAKLLRDRGYVVVGLRSPLAGLGGILGKFRNRVSGGELTSFTRQLATMVNAGLPLTDGLTILRLQSKPAVQAIVTQILADVEGGQSLSKAMEKHKKVFSTTYIALVRAGETGGVLDKILARLADNMEKQQEFKGKVIGAMIYPAIIVVGMVGVSILMVIFVIPKLITLYDQFDAELPLITRILTGSTDLFLKLWPVFLIAFGASFWGFMFYKKTPKGRRKLDELIFRIPLYGTLMKEIILANFTRTLALMVTAGVPILEGLSVTSGVVGNKVISDALDDVSSQVERGFPISYSMAKHPDAFPFLLSQMVAVGEETGKMDEVLTKVSHVFEVNSEERLKALTAAIEPLIMVVLGIGVALLVVSIILPIYNLTSAF